MRNFIVVRLVMLVLSLTLTPLEIYAKNDYLEPNFLAANDTLKIAPIRGEQRGVLVKSNRTLSLENFHS